MITFLKGDGKFLEAVWYIFYRRTVQGNRPFTGRLTERNTIPSKGGYGDVSLVHH